MNYLELKEYIKSNNIDEILHQITCEDDLSIEKQRYLDLLDKAYNEYGDGDYHIISSPGRSEIGGNHTDHQHGHVVACGLNVDNVVIFKTNNSNIVNYDDPKFSKLEVDISDLSINKDDYNTSKSLVKGIANNLTERGYKISGFDAVCDSHVLAGSGISSSACFEVMIAEIMNYLYCDGQISPIDRAIIGQYAENVYFGKPSGLMDQMAISVGSFIAIDFKDPNKPVIENYEFSFADYGYEFCLINTKGDHADLSHEYAAVPNEIRQVGKCLGVDYLADSTMEELLNKLPQIREEIKNDRAVLRSLHFYQEDKRAVEEKNAIKSKDIKSLLNLMKESGRSSFEYLQNVYPASRPTSQSLAVGLFLADYFVKNDGAYRVHGGGFDGTIQVILPKDKLDEFKKLIYPVFGDDALLVCKVRPFGTKTII